MENELQMKRKKLWQEEEEEEREIMDCCLRLGYMYENCMEYDQKICGLIEEQWGRLEVLRMKKREFQDEWEKNFVTFGDFL